MSDDHKDVLEAINSSGLAFHCIDFLRQYSTNIGIHHYLVKKLYSYSYDELEFFIPQLIQLMVSFETDSMALEEFLLDYSAKYPHFSLIVFWNLQAYIFELRNEPESYSFQTIRKFINKLQDILFNTEVPNQDNSFRENLQPSLVLCGAVAAGFGLPKIQEYASPIIKTQGKQQKSFVFKLANFQKSLTRNLTMKNQRMSSDAALGADDDNTLSPSLSVAGSKIGDSPQIHSSLAHSSPRRSANFLSDDSETNTTDEDSELRSDIGVLRKHRSLDLRQPPSSFHREVFSDVEENLRINTTIKSKKTIKRKLKKEQAKSVYRDQLTSNSQSMPDLTHTESQKSTERPKLSPTESESCLGMTRPYRDHSASNAGSIRDMHHLPTFNGLMKVLQVNYSKKETDFMMSLQNISLRLSQLPKEARLSALRAELSIINENLLPSEIDIPQLLPITSNRNKKYHKLLKLSVNEACVLNSAERVPFLLFVEYLSDEIDFNPFSEQNQKIISRRSKMKEPKSEEVTEDLISMVKTNVDSSPPQFTDNDDTDRVIMGEADLGDMPIMSRKSSGHDLNRIKLFDNNIDNLRQESTAQSRNSAEISTKVLADQMRIASVMLQQLENSGQAASEQSTSIRSRIVDSMISLQDQFDSINYDKLNQLRGDDQDAGERKLENDFKLGEDWATKKMRIKSSSIYGHLENWDLCSVIVKNGDDLPQEAFACQLITMISGMWKKHNISFWTKRMKILITSANAGLVETITNAISIHSIKKSLTEISISRGENSKGRIFTLLDYFVKIYGSPTSTKYKQAQENFAKSLASYSIICYVLQIKDRHNGNIMLDNEGHIIHIDFGFLLSNSPGSVGFEAAPFKLTAEYVELMGGIESSTYETFKNTCKQCFKALRKESDQIVSIVELMQKDSTLPCFKSGENTSILLKQRLQLHLNDEESESFVETTLIGKSLGSMYTRLYDQFQMVTQGIYS
ncbi:kinase-like protein [Hyphopichia burtonii NRRL Y-1933]|uniref:1-phosphatidylinositol 4-kinase n=1 Tax=Hyphopichia burtonii NRRL Y-1933 TaxID=984485 RepID=A0A1E4RDD0_9ASCO|nr:kinase-like protein [Hyphopichia burtonii NRRL Y-1933]ODV65274.1 kinase-like protein [Hyphopichia burtonii NRRL Y-1933]